jgi:hypothetical protein
MHCFGRVCAIFLFLNNKPCEATSVTDFPWDAAILPTTEKITKPAKILVEQFMIEIKIASLKFSVIKITNDKN